MTKIETLKLMAVIKTAYSEFNKTLTEEEDEVAENLWHRMLEPYSYESCNNAISQHIRECKFAPKISEIVDRVKSTIDPRTTIPKQGTQEFERMMRMWRLAYERFGVQFTQRELDLMYGQKRFGHLHLVEGGA